MKYFGKFLVIALIISCGDDDPCYNDYLNCLGYEPSKEVRAICKTELRQCEREEEDDSRADRSDL
jgi:hypothetical protein